MQTDKIATQLCFGSALLNNSSLKPPCKAWKPRYAFHGTITVGGWLEVESAVDVSNTHTTKIFKEIDPKTEFNPFSKHIAFGFLNKSQPVPT